MHRDRLYGPGAVPQYVGGMFLKGLSYSKLDFDLEAFRCQGLGFYTHVSRYRVLPYSVRHLANPIGIPERFLSSRVHNNSNVT